MPGWESLTNGDVRKKKKMTGAMLKGFYRSTYFADPVSGEQFAADAIISNPPTFAHVHVAEALGLPLLMSFSESIKDPRS
jgi:sterol 3beta-glucosyltransferase